MKKHLTLLCIFIVFGLFTGCFAMPVEDPVPPPPITPIPVPRTLRTVFVVRGDEKAYTSVPVMQVPIQEERLSFPAIMRPLGGGVYTRLHLDIAGIYVSVGDTVEAGDIIASVYWPDIQEQYNTARRAEELLLLSLNHIEQRHQLALTHAMELGIPIDDSFYVSETARINRELRLLQIELDYLGAQNESRYLRAGMSGTVTQAITFIPGRTTEPPPGAGPIIIATISDRVRTVLRMNTAVYAPYLQTGDILTLHLFWIRNELGAGVRPGVFELVRTEVWETVEAVVVDPEEMGMVRAVIRANDVYMEPVNPNFVIPPDATKSVRFSRGYVYDALLLVPSAIQRVDDRTFVYILNEYGIVTIRDVVTGMRGNRFYEIISGLEEGDDIVLR